MVMRALSSAGTRMPARVNTQSLEGPAHVGVASKILAARAQSELTRSPMHRGERASSLLALGAPAEEAAKCLSVVARQQQRHLAAGPKSKLRLQPSVLGESCSALLAASSERPSRCRG